MPKVVSKVLHEYAKEMRAPGDVYEAEERHVAILCRLGRVERAMEVQPAAPSKAGEYRTANIEASPEVKQSPAPKRRNRASIVGGARG